MEGDTKIEIPDADVKDEVVKIENSKTSEEKEPKNDSQKTTVEMLSKEIICGNDLKGNIEIIDYQTSDKRYVLPTSQEREGDGRGGGRGEQQTVYYTVEEPLVYEPGQRNPFILKVMALTAVQLFATAACVAIILLEEELFYMFLMNSMMFMLIGLAMVIVVSYAMYKSQCARSAPCNFILLLMNLIGYILIVGSISVRFRTETLFFAFAATAVLVFICFILAMTSFDFTSWMLYVVAISIVLSVLFFMVLLAHLLFSINMRPLTIGLMCLLTIVQSVMLIIELQMILGGKKIELDEREFVFGAYMLYTSIIDIFIKLVYIIGYLFDE